MSGSNFYRDQKLTEIYREERLREAEMARLARQISKKPNRTSYLGAAIVWLGKQMERWGIRLQNYFTQPIQVTGEPNEVS